MTYKIAINDELIIFTAPHFVLGVITNTSKYVTNLAIQVLITSEVDIIFSDFGFKTQEDALKVKKIIVDELKKHRTNIYLNVSYAKNNNLIITQE